MFSPFIRQGVGLHTGRHSEVLVEMGLPGKGVVFIVDGTEIPAVPSCVCAAQQRATEFVFDNKSVKTAEHLLAALAAFGETDVRVFVDGPEIPILDGSALPWSESLMDSGSEPGPRFVGISRKIEVEINGSSARILPLGEGARPVIRVAVDFESAGFARREFSYYPTEDNFVENIAPARTFAFESEIEAIWKNGLARGGSLDCALVLGANGPLNPDGLRFPDEPVRHKLLDAVGDLFLLGGLPWAEVILEKPGHRLLGKLTMEAAGCVTRNRT